MRVETHPPLPVVGYRPWTESLIELATLLRPREDRPLTPMAHLHAPAPGWRETMLLDQAQMGEPAGRASLVHSVVVPWIIDRKPQLFGWTFTGWAVDIEGEPFVASRSVREHPERYTALVVASVDGERHEVWTAPLVEGELEWRENAPNNSAGLFVGPIQRLLR